MQWQYTMTKQEVRAQFRALTRVQGSIANRQMRRLRLIVPLVVVVAMLAFSLIELGGLPTGEQMGTAIVLLILTALMALLFWGLMPVQYVSMQMSALRRSLPEMTSQPYRVTLAEGFLTLDGPGVSGQKSHIHVPAASIRTIQTDRAGLVLVLHSGAGFLMPLSAFSEEAPLPYSRSLFEEAMKTRPAAPEEPKSPDGPVRTGFVPDGEGGGTFVQQLDREQARLLLRERTIAVLKTGTYWRRKWPALVLIALGVGYVTFQYGWVGFAMMAALVAVMLYAMWRRPAGDFDRICGTFTLRFGPEEILLSDSRGSSWQIPYCGKLLETPHAWVLCGPGGVAAYSFAKDAFGDKAEEQAFLAMLNARLDA